MPVAGNAPTSAAARGTRAPGRATAGLLTLALALGWLVAVAAPARAVAEWGVEQPGPGGTVTGSTHVQAFARSVKGEQVDGMRVRFRAVGGGQSGQTRSLSFTDRREEGAGTQRSTWARPFDPLSSGWHGGAAVPNGRYVVEAQAVSSVESVDFGDELRRESGWRGHQITVDAPPPPTSASARVTDAEAGAVEVSWTAASVPDFRRYVVQRASAGGGFTDVHTATDAAAVSYADRVDGDGDYRYRVRVVRAGASGERESVSEPAAVAVQGSPPEGDSEEGPDGGDGEGDGGSGGGGASGSPGRADSPRLSTRTEGGSGSEPSDDDVRAPRTAPGPGVDDDFERPSGDVFDETLDYDTAQGQPPRAADREQDREQDGRDGEDEPVPRGQASGPERGGLTVWNGRELGSREVLVPVAAGLVLILGGLHVRRFLNP